MLKERNKFTDCASVLSPPAVGIEQGGRRERGRVVFVLTQSHIVEAAVGKQSMSTPGPPTHPLVRHHRQVLSGKMEEEEQVGNYRGLVSRELSSLLTVFESGFLIEHSDSNSTK